MTLRTRTTLITIATLLALTIAVIISAKTVLHRGFGWVEEENARKDTIRAMNALDREIEAVDLITHDWASWDMSYSFVVRPDRAFVDEYLYFDGFVTIDINFIAYINPAGKIAYSHGYDLGTGNALALPDSLARIIERGDRLVRHARLESSARGLLMLPEGPVLFAARPITTTKEDAPVRGALLFARYLDSTKVTEIETATQVGVNFQRWDNLPGDFAEARAALSGADSIFVSPLDENRIAGYVLIRDVYGNPALVLRVVMPRDILAQEKRVQDYLLWVILVVGVAFTAAMFLFLEFSVLLRLKHLSRDFSAIGRRSDFSGRITTRGDDELTGVATAGNRMLDALEESHNRIRRRNQEMRTIMDTVSVGLLSLDREFRITGEYSESAAVIFERANLTDRDFIRLLGLDGDGEATLREYLELVLDGTLLPEDLSNLNPFPELPIPRNDGGIRWVRLEYRLMHRDEKGREGVVLVQAEDITEGKDLAEQAAQAEADAAQIIAAAENPDIFREFLSQAVKISFSLRDGAAALKAGRGAPELIDALLRDAHTLKGTASAFGAASLSHAAGEMEERLSSLRDTGEPRETVLGELEYFENLILSDLETVRAKTAKIFGGAASEEETWLRVPLREVESAIRDARTLVTGGDSAEPLIERLRSFRMIPAERGFARAVRIIEDLIRRTGERAAFRIEGAGVPVDCEIARELNSSLVHLFRNSLAHGIEVSSERILRGKPERGVVALAVRRDDGGVVLEFSDDGRGIDVERIRAKAVERGILTPDDAARMSAEDCIELVFRPGFSTAESVSGLSGRGVGLDAVRADIRRLDGTIHVDFSYHDGARFVIFVPDRTEAVSG